MEYNKLLTEVMRHIREQSKTYQELLDMLTEHEMQKDDAEKLLKTLLDIVHEEDS